jgi:outer membrane protein assembly factor BamB
MKWQKLTLLTLVFATSTALAVKTNYWTDAESKSFKTGKTENIVISNLDRMTLGLGSKELLSGQTDVSLVFDVRMLADGAILAATGSDGRLMIYRGEKWETLYKADQPYIFALEVSKAGTIYLGTGGDKGKVIELSADGKKVKELFANDDVRYIWQIQTLPDGRLVAATGPNGKLFVIDKGKAKEIFSCKQKNLQAMAIGKDGSIFVGTDTDAIIYKIEQKNGEFVSRAIYDAAEKEISVLAVDEKGFLYAATASGIQGKDQARSYLTKPQGTPVSTLPTTASGPASKPADAAEGEEEGEEETAQAQMPMMGPGGPGMPMPPFPMPNMDMGGESPSPAVMGKGNAVYRFDTMGFVTEVFRDKVDINAMILDRGVLYLGTGPEGWLFSVNPETEEVSLLAKTDAKNMNAVIRTSDGSLVLGTTSPAKVVKLGPELAKTGTFTSKVFDARQITRWGMIRVTAANQDDPGCCATVQTRSSEIKKAEDPGWSEWSKAVDVKNPSHITSPSARYFQYRINFESKDQKPAVIDEIEIAYMQDNLRPEIASVEVNTGQGNGNAPSADDDEGPSDGPAMPPMMAKKPSVKQVLVKWKAADPNRDPLKYSVYLRRANTPYWIELEKDTSMPLFKWDPQTVADGRYEFKVVASDELANPVGMGLTSARVSDAFVVDNTPPAVKNLDCSLTADGKILIKADLVDELTEIDSAWVTINADKDWQYLAPADELYDSKTEKLENLLPVTAETKPIMITIKVEDRSGNVGYGWQVISGQ